MTLRFKTADVKRILAHSAQSKKHSNGYDGPTGPGLFIVGDDGVYLMSTGKNIPQVPRVKGKGKRCDIVYAEECNPETLSFDDWWEAKGATFGADDGVEYLPASMFKNTLSGEYVKLSFTKSSIKVRG